MAAWCAVSPACVSDCWYVVSAVSMGEVYTNGCYLSRVCDRVCDRKMAITIKKLNRAMRKRGNLKIFVSKCLTMSIGVYSLKIKKFLKGVLRSAPEPRS